MTELDAHSTAVVLTASILLAAWTLIYCCAHAIAWCRAVHTSETKDPADEEAHDEADGEAYHHLLQHFPTPTLHKQTTPPPHNVNDHFDQLQTEVPYNIELVPFVKESVVVKTPKLDGDSKSIKSRKKHIIVGGRCATSFYDVLFSKQTNEILFKSFEKDYKKTNANLNKIRFKSTNYYAAMGTQSHMMSNGNEIIIYHVYRGYNAYDIKNDAWILAQNRKIVDMGHVAQSNCNPRSLLINDEILIISDAKQFDLYSIAKRYNHFTDPQIMKRHLIETKGLDYFGHGMCCTGLDIISKNGSRYYKIKVVLFGSGHRCDQRIDLWDSFLQVDITIDVNYGMIVNENCVDIKEETLKVDQNYGGDRPYIDNLDSFGFECIFNSKQQPILVIIGGQLAHDLDPTESAKHGKCVIACNTVTGQVTIKRNVCFIV